MTIRGKSIQFCLALVFALVWLTRAEAAQRAKPAYTPRVGQAGKDVVWVPTPESLVDKMLGLAKVTPSDYLIDLGSGDTAEPSSPRRSGARARMESSTIPTWLS